MQRCVVIILSSILFLVSISTAQAQLSTLTVFVDGMACPFCAYGIEKKLKRVEGVESLRIDINAGTATMTATDGLSIKLNQVPGAIRDSGFSAREIRVEATGSIRQENERLILQYNGDGKRFPLKGMVEPLESKLRESMETGQSVSVSGTLEMRPEGWVLRPETVEVVSE